MRWILISGESEQAFSLRRILTQDGFRVAYARNLEQTEELLSTRDFSVIIMRGYSHDEFSQWLHDIELMLPVPHKCPPILLMHSAERCNEIHADWAPVFCTHDQTTGEEILLRIRALLRRASGYPNHRYIGPLGLDPLTHRAYLNGWPIALRAKEIELLQALHDRGTRAVSYERLEAVVWMGKPNARARLASQIRNLRASLERQGVPITIRNVKGYGYRLVQAVPQRNGTGRRSVSRKMKTVSSIKGGSPASHRDHAEPISANQATSRPPKRVSFQASRLHPSDAGPMMGTSSPAKHFDSVSKIIHRAVMPPARLLHIKD